MEIKYIVEENCKYTTIKEILIQEFKMSHRLISKLNKLNKIFCNYENVNLNYYVDKNDTILIDLSYDELCENIVPTPMDIDIIYEDEWLIAINKQPNTPVHPSLNHYTDSLSNGLKSYFESIGLYKKIRPINRLDKDTSGIVLFAKNEYIQESLIAQMKNGLFSKEYLALVEGNVCFSLKKVVAPIARKTDSIIERCVSNNGDYAETIFELKKVFNNYSLLNCTLKTGRTHQIRVHSSYIGHPILGDTLYGTPSKLISRQALHAYKVSFIHPITKNYIIISCPLPNDMSNLL